jgi:hypothetical protein
MSVCDNCMGDNVPDGCEKAHKTFRKHFKFNDGTVYEACSRIHKSYRIK